jgi:hypothetical protein
MAPPKSTAKAPRRAVSQTGDSAGTENTPNPVWFKPVMFGFMILGLVWIIVFYLSQQSWPIPQIGVGNIGVGFGLLIIGFFMTTRWR